MTKDIYKSDMKNKTFSDKHCWSILSRCPKWCPDLALNVEHMPPMHSELSSFVDLHQSSPTFEDTPIGGLRRPEGHDKQRTHNEGKSIEESCGERDQQRDALLDRGALLEERNASRAIYDSHKIERERKKWQMEDEEVPTRGRVNE
ncbi:unnamed protein product [Linum tenue]|uniref:No apical meristem-associated C-terminal domain-containing protein n=1 Tax=Linum tenue TaxID=586396 RepID=A0AAV0LKV5_9ROSI|nr:unnamed protein product [Linum tenue]